MWDWIGKLTQIRASGKTCAIVTVTKCEGSTPRECGAKMIVLPSGAIFGSIGGGLLEKQAIEAAEECIKSQTSKTFTYSLCARSRQCCGGRVDLFFEVMNSGPVFYIFGAGHVSQAVCKVLEETPFEIHVIDERKQYANPELFPQSVKLSHVDWEEFVTTGVWDAKRTYAVVMTHSHELDQEIIKVLATKPAKYIGLIGSATKWRRFKEQLQNVGLSSADLDRVRCPIGLEIGGKAPKEIAISLAAELLKIHNAK